MKVNWAEKYHIHREEKNYLLLQTFFLLDKKNRFLIEQKKTRTNTTFVYTMPLKIYVYFVRLGCEYILMEITYLTVRVKWLHY